MVKNNNKCYNIYYMNPEKAKRRQSLKVIISESIMVLAIILMVTALAFIVSGYWLNSDFKVERNGLLQISSVPTGADISIDSESAWMQRTNTSKVLSSGQHTITLTKDGYDSWTKTINISEGLLYRIHYPRLFPNDRTAENVLDVTSTTLATTSPDHNSLILINDTTNWSFINLDSDDIKPQILDISKIFSSVSLAEDAEVGLFTGKILDIDWDYNGTHALFKVQSDDATEWALLDVKNPKNSINLTREFGSNFTEVQILDNDSNNLLAVQNGNLHRIDIYGKSLSAVLIENIVNFDHYGNNEIIFSAKNSSTEETAPYYIGLLKIDDDKITTLATTPTPAKVTLSKFYDDKYITILEGNLVSLYQKEDFKPLHTFELTFEPNTMEVGHSGEFITMTLDNQIATLDMESTAIIEWQTDSPNFGWIDNDMIYSIASGNLTVYDYDGLNRRTIATNVSSHFPAAITNNKWLYYFSDDSLVREVITN